MSDLWIVDHPDEGLVPFLGEAEARAYYAQALSELRDGGDEAPNEYALDEDAGAYCDENAPLTLYRAQPAASTAWERCGERDDGPLYRVVEVPRG